MKAYLGQNDDSIIEFPERVYDDADEVISKSESVVW